MSSSSNPLSLLTRHQEATNIRMREAHTTASLETSNSPIRLLQLAPELLQQVLAFLNPTELVSFGVTCSIAHGYLSPRNQILWRSSFLQEFDDPRQAWKALLPTARAANVKAESEWNWYEETRNRYLAVKAVISDDAEYRRRNYNTNASTIINMIETAKGPSTEPSLNIAFLDSVFQLSQRQSETFVHDFFPDLESPAFPFESNVSSPGRRITRSYVNRQCVSAQSSRLHILYGVTERERKSNQAKGAARALVYDWFQTGPNADYGPFQQDGSGKINWEVLEALYSVIVRNFELVTDGRWTSPQGFRASVPVGVDRSIDHAKNWDWARISGPWIGTYSFLDYTDLFQYNVGYRPGQQPHLEDHQEACGDLMRLELEVVDSLEDDNYLKTDLPICNDLPMLYFAGISRGHESDHQNHNILVRVRGFVALLPDGKQVRWRFIISYGGEDQWHLEGVQPSGIRTGGIFGFWSHCDHEQHGPIGPFCYYPQEECEVHRPSLGALHGFRT